MTEIDFEAFSVSDASDAEAIAFRNYMLALRAHRAKKTLLSMQSLDSATDELTQRTLPEIQWDARWSSVGIPQSVIDGV